MRAIEQRMTEAIRTRKNFRKDNTEVTVENGEVSVKLFKNIIAIANDAYEAITLAGWNTITTKSRLKTILMEMEMPVTIQTVRGVTTYADRREDMNDAPNYKKLGDYMWIIFNKANKEVYVSEVNPAIGVFYA